MDQRYQGRARIYSLAGRSFLERVLVGIAGLAILILAFFFLTIALVAGAILAGVILLRVWWVARKIRKARAARRDEIIEGEFTTVDAERDRLDPPGR